MKSYNAYDLGTQRTRASAVMILTSFSRNIPVSGWNRQIEIGVTNNSINLCHHTLNTCHHIANIYIQRKSNGDRIHIKQEDNSFSCHMGDCIVLSKKRRFKLIFSSSTVISFTYTRRTWHCSWCIWVRQSTSLIPHVTVLLVCCMHQ